MYVIRRGWKVEPRQARLAATLAAAIGRRFEDAGQREPVKVYFNGGTLPGEKGNVYMEWTSDVIESPYRGDNVSPPDPRGLSKRLYDMSSENWIEFHELLSDDKAVDLED